MHPKSLKQLHFQVRLKFNLCENAKHLVAAKNQFFFDVLNASFDGSHLVNDIHFLIEKSNVPVI